MHHHHHHRRAPQIGRAPRGSRCPFNRYYIEPFIVLVSFVSIGYGGKNSLIFFQFPVCAHSSRQSLHFVRLMLLNGLRCPGCARSSGHSELKRIRQSSDGQTTTNTHYYLDNIYIEYILQDLREKGPSTELRPSTTMNVTIAGTVPPHTAQ